jgi:hypothetical protein
MGRVSEEAKAAGDGARQASNASRRARRRPRASRVAGGLAVAILLVMLGAYIFSMYSGGMEHSVSGDTTLPEDAVVTTVVAPVAAGQMVMSDGSVMDMDEHSSASTGIAVAEADHDATAPAGTSHSEGMGGGSVNWYVIGGVLALIAAVIAVAAGLKERLARGIATSGVTTEGVSGE